MATQAYSTDLQNVTLCDSGTFTEMTGYTAGTLQTVPETDYFIQGAGCVSSTAKTTYDSIAFDYGSGITLNSGEVFLFWQAYWAPGTCGTFAQGGQRILIGSAVGTFRGWISGGSDYPPNPYGGWKNVAIDPTVTADYNPSTSITYQFFAVALYLPSTYPGKGAMFGMDAVRWGRAVLRMNGGDGTYGYCDFTRMANFNDANNDTFTATTTLNNNVLTSCSDTSKLYIGATITGTNIPGSTTITNITSTTVTMSNNASGSGSSITVTQTNTNRYGMFQSRGGGSYLWKGQLYFGYSTAVDFRDSNKIIFIDDTPRVTSSFNTITIDQSGSRVDWTNVVFAAMGTTARGVLTMSASADVNIDGCLFKDMDTFTFLSSASVINSSFVGCNQIDSGGGSFLNTKVLTPTVSADTSGFKWNSATDPDGYMDDMIFTKGTAAHHAIEFGTSSPTSITLRGITFTDFNASNSQNDSVLHILRTTGTVTVSCVGCSGTVSYKSAGAAVSIVIDPVTVGITVKDLSTGLAVENARVLVAVANDNNFPYQDSVTITSSGTTATVSHTGHGLASGDYIIISGANEDAYNGVHEITYIGVDSYSYVMASSASSPATGTITATFAIIGGELTNSSGYVSDSRTYSSDQLFTGWVRKGTSAPYYKEFALGDTVDNVNGYAVTVQLVRDE